MYQPKSLETLPDDPTVAEVRAFLPPFIADEAVFDGWADSARDAAAAAQGIDANLAILAFDDGAMDMIDAWIGHIDAQMIAAFPPERIAGMKIRERTTELLWFRLMAVTFQKEALRRAIAVMASPVNAPRTARISWRSADLMWRMAGDTATDYNHYTKRTILTGVYGSTLVVFMDDQSDDHAETRAFLERRIENVMQFEKTKAKLLNPNRERISLARFLGRLRYPAR